MVPVEVTIDLHGDAKSNGQLSLFILFNFSLEFNTADCSLFLETFSLVSSVTFLLIHVCLFVSYLSGHSASVSFVGFSLPEQLDATPSLHQSHSLPGVISQPMILNTNCRLIPLYIISLARVSPLISRLTYPTSNLTLPLKCLIVHSKFRGLLQQDLLNLPLHCISILEVWTGQLLLGVINSLLNGLAASILLVSQPSTSVFQTAAQVIF